MLQILLVLALVALAIMLLAFVIPVVAMIMGTISIYLAMFASFKGIISGIRLTFQDKTPIMKKLYHDGKEPATKSWFFGPSFSVVPFLFKTSFSTIMTQACWLKDKWDRLMGTSLILTKIVFFAAGIVTNIVHWTFCLVLTVFWGAFFTVLFLIMTFLFYLFYLIVLGIDRIVLLARGYKNDCPHCNERSLIPEYICPNCGAIHKKLSPNKYGVFDHMCECGCYLGATFLSGKGRLNARCPHCHEEFKTGATKPLTLQLIGGTTSGKTVYLAALFHELHEKFDAKGAKHEYDPVCEDKMKELDEFFHGKFANATSGRDVQFYADIVEGKNAKVPTKFEIVDIPGEMFAGNVALEEGDHRMSQYQYSNGFLFMIDPFAEGDLKQYQNMDASTEYSAINPEEVFNNFDKYLISQGFAKGDRIIEIPISVIITKADTEEVNKRINMQMIEEEFANNPEAHSNSFDKCRDDMIKEFLTSISQAALVNNVEARFRNVHYFIASPMGHSPEDGKMYEPWGVVESVKWIIANKDKKFFDDVIGE